MFVKIILFLISMMFGIAVSAGFIAFIVLIGAMARIIGKTHTAKHVLLYENILVLGVTAGNVVYLYHLPLPVGQIGLAVMGLFSGIFTGCLAGALAEVIDIFPIFTRRFNLRKGLPYAVCSLAIGKGIGTFLQWFVLGK